jgi:hypothetical protein
MLDTIQENGVSIELDHETMLRLERMGLLYYCQMEHCQPPIWHILNGFDWCDIDLALIQLDMESKE